MDPRRLGRAFVELADTLVADFDVVEFMATLAHRSIELLDVDEAAVVLDDGAGGLRTMASSHEAAGHLELFELQKQEGPCLDCYRTGTQILNQSLVDPAAARRWPRFTPEARRLGFATTHALPMRLRGRIIGAVNLFGSAAAGTLSGLEVEVGQGLADVATVGLVQWRRFHEARLVSEQLQSALSSRIVIEQAKGMLAERRQIALGAAFEALRTHARNTNQRLRDVAQALVDGAISADAVGA
ncbi:MAG TPA: GAF and ANTAR domain-containing protein [Acidimicrobiales bacterium]